MAERADSTRIRLAELPTNRPTLFDLAPEAGEMGDLADALELLALRKLRFSGQLSPRGRADWLLEAELGATVVQPCVATLDPVTTRIDEPVRRLYLEHYSEPEEGEAEMPEDDEAEPLPAVLDLAEVMREALALALPPFPRAEGVDLGEQVFTEPGVEPLRDKDVKPFAGLADLKKKMEE